MAKKTKELTLEEKLEQALVPREEWPYEVPENWCWVRLDVLKESISGFFDGDWILSENMDNDGTVRLLQLSDIGIGEFLDKSNKHISVDTFEKLNCTELLEGDVMISRMAEPIARSCIVPQFSYRVITAVDVAVLRCNKHIARKEYVNYLCNAKWFTDMALEKARGTTRIRITRKNLGEMPVPLPPLSEQQRVVDRIESLFAKLNEAKEIAEEIVNSFEMRKSAILHKAFTGELTAKWRQSHGVGMESWETLLLGDIIANGPQNGLYKPKTAYGSGTKILRIDGFYDGYVESWDSLKQLELSDEEIELYELHLGDIVINRVNSIQYLGKSALIRNLPSQCVFESNMMRISLKTECAYPEYVIRYLNSDKGLSELRRNAKHAVNQASINQQDVKNVSIPLPLLEEQIEVVGILKQLLNNELQSKEAAETVLDQIDIMKKAILARAFRGELGTNNKEDIPAEEILRDVLKG